MKNLIVLGLVAVSAMACTSAQQTKVNAALDVLECKADVLAPYVAYFRSDEFVQAVANDDYFKVLEEAGVTPAQIEQLVKDLKACKPAAEVK